MSEFLAPSPSQKDKEIANEAETNEYSPTDLEGIDMASQAAVDMIQDSIENNHGSHEVVNTDEGLRGILTEKFPYGSIEAMFDSATLSQVNMNIQLGDEEHVVSIIHPEESDTEILLDDVPVDPSEIPSVQKIIESIRSEREARREAANSGDTREDSIREGVKQAEAAAEQNPAVAENVVGDENAPDAPTVADVDKFSGDILQANTTPEEYKKALAEQQKR